MPGRESRAFAGSGVSSQVGLIVIALLVGLLVPVALVGFLSTRDPEPRSCRSGIATPVHVGGAIAWATPAVLWYTEGDVNHARRLVDYAPVSPALPASPSPGASPSTSPSAAATVSPEASLSPRASAGPTPGASPSPPPLPGPVFEAAAISPDRQAVVYLVSNPPDEPGMISLRVTNPQDPPHTTPLEAFAAPWVRDSSVRSEVSYLPNGIILFKIAHRFPPPETDRVLVGAAEAGAAPKLDESDPQRKFLATDHSTWPELKGYTLPPEQPILQTRVIAPNRRAAGELTRLVSTPLVTRTLHEVHTGTAGSAETTVVCASGDSLESAAFSPDGHTLAVVTGETTQLLDLDGNHAVAPLLRGRVLAWRP